MHPSRGGHDASPRGGGIVLNDLLIWVLVPVLSYLAGALFQAGYNHYFGLPDLFVSADPVATFDAVHRYLELITQHFGWAVALPLAFLAYLTALPAAFYRQHAAVVLALAGSALFVSFGIRPYVWALACTVVLIAIQFRPASARPPLIVTNPLAVKSLAIVAFFYATLFSAGFETGRYETEFFVTDHDTRYVVLAIDDKDAIAAELLDPQCRPVKQLPDRLIGFHFDQHIKVFTLGDTDTPPIRLYDTDGLTSSAACRRGPPVPVR